MFAQSICSWKLSGLISVEILLLHPFLISRGLAGLSEGGKSLGLGSNRDNLVFKEGWRRPGFGDSPLGDLLCWPVKPIYIPAVPQPSGFLREQLIGVFFSLSPGNILSCRCLFCHHGPLICCRANSTTQVGLLHWSFKPGLGFCPLECHSTSLALVLKGIISFQMAPKLLVLPPE